MKTNLEHYKVTARYWLWVRAESEQRWVTVGALANGLKLSYYRAKQLVNALHDEGDIVWAITNPRYFALSYNGHNTVNSGKNKELGRAHLFMIHGIE